LGGFVFDICLGVGNGIFQHALPQVARACSTATKRKQNGKVLKARTRKVPSRLARAMRLAAFGLQRNDSQIGPDATAVQRQAGESRGITATAQKLARVICGVIKSQRLYDEQEAFKVSPQKLQRRHRRL
jgi:hypothetical protein